MIAPTTPSTHPAGTLEASPSRLISLDALRGFTIAAMLLVNFPGDGDHVYHPLQHTRWNGLSFTDLIAPLFLFIIGVSIVFAYAKRLESGAPRGKLYRKIIVRSVKIFAVGMFLNLLPTFDVANLRWTGTLHRIAFVFLICSVIFLNTNWKQQAWIGVLTLVVYWLALTQIPTPGYGKVMLEPGANLVAWFDSLYLPGRMWKGTWDPESILSTFPSAVSGLTGMLAGRLLVGRLPRLEKVAYLMTVGLFTAAAGYGWNLTFPSNENLWTSSFVLITSGFAALLLGAIYFLVDILGRTQGTQPGIIFGANAIAVYVMGDLLSTPFYYLKFGGHSLNEYGVSALTSLGFDPRFASMGYALFFVAVNFLPAYLLYRKRIFIKL
ncbi:acyltransferase family protein [Larkinella insperata]|uniref:Acyltransferase family protein n=1 Tax=Larkinella insperata TaxID=332158 RepID=A0ABW3QCD2_9BACT|nr:heparan-alpha-glucosaminide N-acetyltransferase domain-containing protein [Larkinella insperata]